MAKVFVTPQAQKDLKKIPRKDKEKIKRKLSLLEENRQLGKKLTGKLEGLYSLKIWPYRAIYLIKDKKEIWIVYVAHRQGVYR